MIIEANHRILLVDDNPAIHQDFRKILIPSPNEENKMLDAAEAMLFEEQPISRAIASNFTIESAFQGREALDKVKKAIIDGQPYALAFVDVRMPPGWDGIETIEHLWAVDPSLQVVICTAYSDYSWETMIERLGVSDNLLLLKKPFDNVEVLQISHALTKKWLVTRRAELRFDELDHMVRERTRDLEAAGSEIRHSEERFSQAFRNNPIAQAIQTLKAQRFVDVNEAFLQMTGFTRGEIVGRTPIELRLCLDYESRFLQFVRDGKAVHNAEAQVSTRGGELRSVLLSLEPLTLSGEPHVLLMAQDITDQRQLENQLRQAQKMEAIGQLAAGIAHDFNNLLTIIQGHASLHLNSQTLPREITGSFHQISGASERAADLTRKLLTFSRRSMMRPRVLDLNETIQTLGKMLLRLLGERTQLRTELAEKLPAIFADVTSVEQILMNLALNGRDAMPDGGTITIATTTLSINGDAPLRHPEARSGDFICLSVADTGTGMDEHVRSRIFEPFFTTKGLNKGTGMGLATVYGIVKQHEGWLEVDTGIGKGSTFRVFLPVTARAVEPSPTPAVEAVPDDGKHTILVVEDDASVRSLVVEVLQSFNYRVIAAETGDAAIAQWPGCMDEVDLLLTDMVMPGEHNGLAVARHCLSTKPNLKVIYTSGYSSELFDSNVQLKDGVNYLPKPYMSGKLTSIIRNALDPAAAELACASA